MSGFVVLADDLELTLCPQASDARGAEWNPQPPVRLTPSTACPRPGPGDSGAHAAPFAVSALTALEEAGIDPALLARMRSTCRLRGEAPRRVLERLIRSWLILELAQGSGR